MATLEEILSQALGAGVTQVAMDDPYAPLAGTASQIGDLFIKGAASREPSSGNTRDAILGAAISGLFSGGLSGLSSGYQADRTAKYNDLLLGAMGGQDVTGNDAVTRALARTAQTQGEQAKFLQAAKALQEKQDVENNIAQNVAVDKARQDPAAASFLLEKLLGVKVPEPEPIARPASESQGLFKDVGIESLDAKEEAYAQERIAAGATPNAAYERAAQRFKGIREQEARGLKKIEDLTKSTQDAKALLDSAEVYIQEAGDTGGVGGYGAGLQNVASAIFQPKKRTATTNMDSLAAKFLSLNRPVGSGSTDRYEAEQYIKGGISSANEPDTNKEIVRRMRFLTNLDAQYADFLDSYRMEKGTLEGADNLWSKYTQENPAFAKTKEGEIVENPNIKTWDKWIISKSSPTAPSEPDAPTQGNIITAPDGKRILIVD